MRRLKRGERMLVDELDLPTALELEAELIESRHIALEHHAIDEEQSHAFRVAGRGGEKQVLKRRLRARRRRIGRHEVRRWFGGHDRRNRVLVDELRSALTAEEQREGVEPGDHALKLDAFDQENGQ